MKVNGIHFAILTTIVSGISIFINKYAVGAIQPALVFTTVKNSAVALLVFALIIFSRKISRVKKLTSREIKYLLAIGLVGGFLPFYLYFTGLSLVPAINAALIHKTLVVWVAILAIPLLGEKLSRLQIVAITLLFFGNLFIGGFTKFQFSIGELMILVATIFWAIENILAKKILSTVDPDLVVAARLGIGSLLLLTASIIFYPKSVLNLPGLSSSQLFWLSATIVTLFLYTTTWYRALKFAPATVVTSVLVASTLITNLLSVIFVTHNWLVLFTLPSLAIFLGFCLFLYSLKPLLSNTQASPLPLESAS